MRINCTIFLTKNIKDETEQRIETYVFFVDSIMLYNIHVRTHTQYLLHNIRTSDIVIDTIIITHYRSIDQLLS